MSGFWWSDTVLDCDGRLLTDVSVESYDTNGQLIGLAVTSKKAVEAGRFTVLAERGGVLKFHKEGYTFEDAEVTA